MHRQQSAAVAARPRRLFIDNLRSTMIILVVSMHAADTYRPLGSWYFVDRKPLSAVALLTFAAWQMYLQSFFMGLLFFIAGYFVPGSFHRKGPWRFVRDRAYRLGLPVLLYMFVLGPFTEYFCAHSVEFNGPYILYQRVGKAYTQRAIPAGKWPPMVLPRVADFLPGVCCAVGPAPRFRESQ